MCYLFGLYWTPIHELVSHFSRLTTICAMSCMTSSLFIMTACRCPLMWSSVCWNWREGYAWSTWDKKGGWISRQGCLTGCRRWCCPSLTQSHHYRHPHALTIIEIWLRTERSASFNVWKWNRHIITSLLLEFIALNYAHNWIQQSLSHMSSIKSKEVFVRLAALLLSAIMVGALCHLDIYWTVQHTYYCGAVNVYWSKWMLFLYLSFLFFVDCVCLKH